MNIGLTTSFIIAGVLLLSILSMNMNISRSSTDLTMRQINQRRAGTIAEILQKDIPNVGYQQSGPITSPIKDARKDLIRFESDIDNDGTPETVSWEFTNTAVSSTANPNDFILTRTVDGNTSEFKTGITHFEIIYRDINRNTIDISLTSKILGNDQNERDKIRYIDIQFTLQIEEKIGGASDFIETIWNKEFTPINLRL